MLQISSDITCFKTKFKEYKNLGLKIHNVDYVYYLVYGVGVTDYWGNSWGGPTSCRHASKESGDGPPL